MSYKIDYIDKHDIDGVRFGLDNIYELLHFMDIQYKDMKVIHIAGTNGKGSVGAFLMYILANAGYKVGRFSSPIVFEEREFAQIMIENNITNISELFLKKKLSEINELKLTGKPSGFEVQVAISFSYFIENKCDIVIVEAGMGGAMDATNVFDNTLCDVITSISMDHMDMLGETIKHITMNKCGIITENGNVVSSAKNVSIISDSKDKIISNDIFSSKGNSISKDIYDKKGDSFCNNSSKECITNIVRKSSIIEEVSKEKNASIYIADVARVSNIKLQVDNNEFVYKDKIYSIRQNGEYQIENAIIAIETVNVLKKSGYKIDDLAVQEGLKKMKLKGRFDIIEKNPYIIVDGAHNIDGMCKLIDSIDKYFYDKKVIFCTSIFKDKEYAKMMEIMCGKAYKIYCFDMNKTRATSSSKLCSEALKYMNKNNVIQCRDFVDSEEKIKALFEENMLSKEDYIVVYAGSLSFMKSVYH